MFLVRAGRSFYKRQYNRQKMRVEITNGHTQRLVHDTASLIQYSKPWGEKNEKGTLFSRQLMNQQFTRVSRVVGLYMYVSALNFFGRDPNFLFSHSGFFSLDF